jgi:hypothetical protein
MRYRVEYLTWPPDEKSVCHILMPHAYTITGARKEALAEAGEARARGARGFQMRDLYKAGWVVALERF